MRITDLEPFEHYVQYPMKAGKFASAQFMQMAAGPPFLSDIGTDFGGSAKGDVVMPIGITQTIAIAQNKALARIFEIGSYRSYFIGSHSVGQITLARVYYNGASLLRYLYAYYGDNVGECQFESMFENNFTADRHNVIIPPGYDNLFMNLGSDLFNNPIGLLLVVRDSDKETIGAAYFEQCYAPAYNIGTDAQGSIVQEGVGLQYERMIPVQVAGAVKLEKLIDHLDNTPAIAASTIPMGGEAGT